MAIVPSRTHPLPAVILSLQVPQPLTVRACSCGYVVVREAGTTTGLWPTGEHQPHPPPDADVRAIERWHNGMIRRGAMYAGTGNEDLWPDDSEPPPSASLGAAGVAQDRNPPSSPEPPPTRASARPAPQPPKKRGKLR